jgi:hypothetical protein
MNQKIKYILILAILTLVLGIVAIGCSQGGGDKNAKTAGRDRVVNTPADSTYNSLMTATALYTCPMHPEFVSADMNAKCPICGMNTEKMSDEKVAAFRAAHKRGQ